MCTLSFSSFFSSSSSNVKHTVVKIYGFAKTVFQRKKIRETHSVNDNNTAVVLYFLEAKKNLVSSLSSSHIAYLSLLFT